jgi:Asp/Glu/hydantoin racemase
MTSSSTSSEDVGDRADALGSAITSHTPGPWSIRLQSSSISARGKMIVFGNPDNPRREADARLIAAAPDLLAVCRKILNHPLIRLTGDVEPELIAAISKANAERERSSSPSTGL